jgi:hypothetical protein
MSQGVLPVVTDGSGGVSIGPADPGAGVAVVERDVSNRSRITMPRGGMSLTTFAQTVGRMQLRTR